MNCTEKGLEALLETIPNELKNYFLRGYIDGDGCFYSNEKNRTIQFCISGQYDTNWIPLINLFKSIGVELKSKKYISNKGHKCSKIRICNKKSLQLIIYYVYKNGFDNLGLKRKYNDTSKIIKIIKNEQNIND